MQPFKRIVYILVAACILVLGVHNVFYNGFKRTYRPFFDKLDTITNGKTNYDVLLLGNSKVQFGLNPLIIDSVAGCNTYNIGLSAASLRVQHALIQTYFNQHAKAPKVLVWCLQNSLLCTTDDAIVKQALYPYTKQPNIADILFKDNKVALWLNRIYPPLNVFGFDEYQRFTAIRGVMGKTTFADDQTISAKGYTSIGNRRGTFTFGKFTDTSDLSLNDTAVLYFEKILNLCAANKTKILAIWPPRAQLACDRELELANINVVPYYNRMCEQYGIKTIRYDLTETFKYEEYMDPSHLNFDGSTRWSKLVGQEVAEALQ